MTDIHLLHAQQERECSWVDDGAKAFMDRLEDADPTMTPAGKGIIKAASAAFQAGLGAYVTSQVGTPRPMQSPTFQTLMTLGVPHVAAVTLHTAVDAVLNSGSGATERTALKAGETLARALEADLRFRAWRKDAVGTERRAVARMRERMKGDPKTWRSRAKQLVELAECPWDRKTLAVVGMDLLGVLVEAAPSVFVARSIQYGHKTYLLFDLSRETAARLALDTEAMSVSRPKFGMMLVPPRPWRYRDEEKA